jgi:hypothetical protein
MVVGGSGDFIVQLCEFEANRTDSQLWKNIGAGAYLKTREAANVHINMAYIIISV